VAGYIGGVCDVFAETGEMVYDEKSMGRNVEALRRICGYIPGELDKCWHGLLWVARCNNEDRMGLELYFRRRLGIRIEDKKVCGREKGQLEHKRDASRGNFNPRLDDTHTTVMPFGQEAGARLDGQDQLRPAW
jgi:hypothetical protein